MVWTHPIDQESDIGNVHERDERVKHDSDLGPSDGIERGGPHLELTLDGGLADAVLSMIRTRFDDVTTHPVPGAGTVLSVSRLDPAGQRALLNLLWDTGHQIVSLSSQR